jgi:hypothetical protein
MVDANIQTGRELERWLTQNQTTLIQCGGSFRLIETKRARCENILQAEII